MRTFFYFADETLNLPGKQPKRGRGGRKKSTRPPSPAILRQRRVAANARERRRMNGLNDAFERLREVSLQLSALLERTLRGHAL